MPAPPVWNIAASNSCARSGDPFPAFRTVERVHDVAAEILAVDRNDLPCMSMLLFGGPASADELSAALHLRRGRVVAALERLQLAGYARLQAGGGGRIGSANMRGMDRPDLGAAAEGGRSAARAGPHTAAFADGGIHDRACAVQEARTRKLRVWLSLPSSPARRAHLRGDLSPAALRRVQVFLEATSPARFIFAIPLLAVLSPYHFSCAFKASAGMSRGRSSSTGGSSR